MQIINQIQTAVTSKIPVNELRSSQKESVSTSLYACERCGTTYIASEMDSCPECQHSLDEVPSGTELGYTSADT